MDTPVEKLQFDSLVLAEVWVSLDHPDLADMESIRTIRDLMTVVATGEHQ